MILTKLKYTGAVPSIAKRELNKIIKAAFEQGGIYWHKVFRPKHFKHRGATEYGYGRRAQIYTSRKLREKGHTYPLVHSGRSRQLTRLRDVRATSKGVRVVLHAPALKYKRAGSKVNMREEMTRISIKERAVLTRLMDRYLDHRFKAIRKKENVKV